MLADNLLIVKADKRIHMVKKLASLLLAVYASVSLAACGEQSSDALQRLNAKYSKASDAIQYNEKKTAYCTYPNWSRTQARSLCLAYPSQKPSALPLTR